MLIHIKLSSIYYLLLIILSAKVFADHSIESLEKNITQDEEYFVAPNQSDMSWRWRILEEQFKNTVYENPEDSVDSRLSAINHIFSASILYNRDVYEFDLDPKLDKQLELRAGQIDGVDDELCGEQLKEILSLMEELQDITEERRRNSSSTRRTEERHLRLAIVLDSYGKYDAGIMAGRARFLGSHDQCINSQLILGDGALKTGMRYCMGKLRTDKHLDPALRQVQKWKLHPDSVFSVAICVPKSCHTKSFRKHKNLFKQLVDSQFKLPKSIYIDENLELDSIFCLLDDSPLAKIPVSGYLFILFLVIWTSLTVYATFFSNYRNEPPSRGQRYILNSLDLRSSYSEFIGEKDRQISCDSRVNLNALNLFKVVSAMLVVYSHAVLFTLYAARDPLRTYRHGQDSRTLIMFLGLTLLTDTFFVLTGLILTFITMKTFSRSSKRENIFTWLTENSIKLALFRYLKLVPLYFLMFWFKKSIFKYLGSGPTWDYGYSKKTAAGYCRQESWLTPFTAQAVSLPMSRQCIPQAWTIAADIFYTVTLAPIIILLTRKPIQTAIIAILISIYGNISMLNTLLSIDLDVQADFKASRAHAFAEICGRFSYIFISPLYKVASILIGMLAGFMLHHYNLNQRLKQWPDWFKGPITKLSLLTVILLPVLPTVGSKIGIDVSLGLYNKGISLSLSVNRLIWALVNAVIFLRLVTDWKEKWLVKCSSGKFWKSMIRLNYPILFVHNELILFDIMKQETVKVASFYNIWMLFSSVYLISLFISIPIHIIIEQPMNKLINHLIRRDENVGKEASVRAKLE